MIALAAPGGPRGAGSARGGRRRVRVGREMRPEDGRQEEDRGNERRPPRADAELGERGGPQPGDEGHDRRGPREAADEAQHGEAERRNIGVRAGGGDGDAQPGQEAAGQDHRARALAYLGGYEVAAARPGGEAVQPPAEPSPKSVEVELVAHRSPEGGG